MSLKGTVILKKRGGLSQIAGKTRSGLKEYRQQRIDRETDGVYVGDYTAPSLPGSKHYLAPLWEDMKDQWAWKGTEEDLAVIVKKLALREKTHTGKYDGNKIDSANLTDKDDKFFTHDSFYLTKYLSNGRIMLNISKNTLDEFFYRNYAGSYTTHDASDPKNEVFSAAAKYEIINPRQVTEKKANVAKESVNAIIKLSELSKDNDKMNLIAEIMDVPTDLTDPNKVFVDLKDHAAENSQKIARFDNKRACDKFMELCETKKEDLNIMAQIIRAKKLRLLTNRGTFTQFNVSKGSILNSRLEGISTDTKLIHFFRQVDNQEYYIELVKLLEELKK